MHFELPDMYPRLLTEDDIRYAEYTEYKLMCKVKGCTRIRHVRDYGALPFVYRVRKSGKIVACINLQRTFFVCDKHWKGKHANYDIKKPKGTYHIDKENRIIT